MRLPAATPAGAADALESPAPETHGTPGIGRRGRGCVVGLVDRAGADEMTGTRFACMDDALELRVVEGDKRHWPDIIADLDLDLDLDLIEE